MSASASDRAFNTRAPACEKASAMPSAIKDSSSQMRIEQPAKLALLMVVSRGAAKRELPEAGAASCNGPRGVPSRRSILGTRSKRDDRRWRPNTTSGAGSVLRGCRMISGGNIAALTQVRMRADLTTFVGSLRRAQELVERVSRTLSLGWACDDDRAALPLGS